MLLYTKLAPPKVPKRRSRAGCTYCKAKKKKCNEERPQCNRCAERGIECSYEPVKPRQRRKRDSTASGAHDGTGSSRLRRSAQTSYSTGRHMSEGSSDESDSISHDLHYQEWGQTPVSATAPARPQLQSWDLEVRNVNADFANVSPLDLSSPFSFDAASMMAAFSTAGEPIVDLDGMSSADSISCILPSVHGTDEGDDTLKQTRRASMSTSSVRSSRNARGVVVPYEPKAQNARSTAAFRSLFPGLAMTGPSSIASPLFEFRPPSYTEFSSRPNRRALVDHFCSVLSHLIVFREESGNPFQQLVLPLTVRSGAVMDAMYALASAHLEYRGVENEERSLYFHNRAIQGLAGLIQMEGKGVDRNELLAAIMLLVYYEVLVQEGRSNIVDRHLKGALAIMCSNPEPSDPTGIFLERAFRFYDVIAALSNGTAPLSAAPAAGCLVPFSPLGAPATSPLNNVDTLLGMATTLWPIIHRLSSLPSLKAELDAAVRAAEAGGERGCSSTKIAVLRTEFETSVSAIEAALNAWQPHLPTSFPSSSPGDPEGETEVADREMEDELSAARSRVMALETGDIPCRPEARDTGQKATEDGTNGKATGSGSSTTKNRLDSILHNALAYRHSALVYLYRTVHDLDRWHVAVQRHARAALRHCEATVEARGPMGALLWPLFVAACEAVDEDDRAVARRTFLGVERRQGMMNIERAWEIVQEVWRRADGEEEQQRQQRCVEVDKGTNVTTVDRVEEVEEASPEPDEGPRKLPPTGGMDMEGVLNALRIRRPASRNGGVRSAGSWHMRGSRGADLWRLVSEDMGVNIVFG